MQLLHLASMCIIILPIIDNIDILWSPYTIVYKIFKYFSSMMKKLLTLWKLMKCAKIILKEDEDVK